MPQNTLKLSDFFLSDIVPHLKHRKVSPIDPSGLFCVSDFFFDIAGFPPYHSIFWRKYCFEKEIAMASEKTKVFVSFDFDHDKTLKDFIIGQAKLADSPFEVSDYSLKEAAPDKEWLDKAHRAIARSDVFMVMLGPHTKNASGVLKEVKIANELEKTKFQLIGYKDGSSDLAVPNAGRVYSWDWDNLKKLLG